MRQGNAASAAETPLLALNAIRIEIKPDEYGVPCISMRFPESDAISAGLTGCGGTGNDAQKSVAEAFKKRLFSFLILLGDNIYPGGALSVEELTQQLKRLVVDFFGESEAPVFLCLGNHELQLFHKTTNGGRPMFGAEDAATAQKIAKNIGRVVSAMRHQLGAQYQGASQYYAPIGAEHNTVYYRIRLFKEDRLIHEMLVLDSNNLFRLHDPGLRLQLNWLSRIFKELLPEGATRSTALHHASRSPGKRAHRNEFETLGLRKEDKAFFKRVGCYSGHQLNRFAMIVAMASARETFYTPEALQAAAKEKRTASALLAEDTRLEESDFYQAQFGAHDHFMWAIKRAGLFFAGLGGGGATGKAQTEFGFLDPQLAYLRSDIGYGEARFTDDHISLRINRTMDAKLKPLEFEELVVFTEASRAQRKVATSSSRAQSAPPSPMKAASSSAMASAAESTPAASRAISIPRSLLAKIKMEPYFLEVAKAYLYPRAQDTERTNTLDFIRHFIKQLDASITKTEQRLDAILTTLSKSPSPSGEELQILHLEFTYLAQRYTQLKHAKTRIPDSGNVIAILQHEDIARDFVEAACIMTDFCQPDPKDKAEVEFFTRLGVMGWIANFYVQHGVEALYSLLDFKSEEPFPTTLPARLEYPRKASLTPTQVLQLDMEETLALLASDIEVLQAKRVNLVKKLEALAASSSIIDRLCMKQLKSMQESLEKAIRDLESIVSSLDTKTPKELEEIRAKATERREAAVTQVKQAYKVRRLVEVQLLIADAIRRYRESKGTSLSEEEEYNLLELRTLCNVTTEAERLVEDITDETLLRHALGVSLAFNHFLFAKNERLENADNRLAERFLKLFDRWDEDDFKTHYSSADCTIANRQFYAQQLFLRVFPASNFFSEKNTSERRRKRNDDQHLVKWQPTTAHPIHFRFSLTSDQDRLQLPPTNSRIFFAIPLLSIFPALMGAGALSYLIAIICQVYENHLSFGTQFKLFSAGVYSVIPLWAIATAWGMGRRLYASHKIKKERLMLMDDSQDTFNAANAILAQKWYHYCSILVIMGFELISASIGVGQALLASDPDASPSAFVSQPAISLWLPFCIGLFQFAFNFLGSRNFHVLPIIPPKIQFPACLTERFPKLNNLSESVPFRMAHRLVQSLAPLTCMLTGVVSLTNLVSELFISSQNNDFPKLVSNLIVAIMAPIQATLLLIASIALARAAVKPAWAERLLVVMHGLAVGVLSAAQTIFLITNFAFVTSADPINFAPTPLLGTVAYVVGIALGALGGILAALVMRDVVRNTNTAQALAQLPSDAERAVPRNTVGILGALRLMFFGAPTSQAIRYGRQLEGGSSMAEQPKDLQQLSDDNPLGEDGFMNQRLVAQTT